MAIGIFIAIGTDFGSIGWQVAGAIGCVTALFVGVYPALTHHCEVSDQGAVMFNPSIKTLEGAVVKAIALSGTSIHLDRPVIAFVTSEGAQHTLRLDAFLEPRVFCDDIIHATQPLAHQF